MMTNQVACPLCRAVTPVLDDSPIGKSIRCGKCGAPFTVGLNDLRPAMPSVRKSRQMGDSKATAPAASALWRVDPQAQTPATQQSGGTKSIRTVPAPERESDLGRYLVLCGVAFGMFLLFGTGVYLAVECFRSDEQIEAFAIEPELDGGASPLRRGFRDPQLQKIEDSPEQPNQVAKRAAPQARAAVDAGSEEPLPPKAAAPVAPPADNAGRPVEPPPAAPAANVAPPMDRQKRIDSAIDFGVKFLRAEQHKDGSWTGSGHLLGTTALPALTLLECGVERTEPCIQRAAESIRKLAKLSTATYEISLALLFLDKLGDKKDKPIIQALALRLLKGQTELGGWDYDCPILSDSQATSLMIALRKTQPRAIPTLTEKSDKTALPTPADKTDKTQPPAILDKGEKNQPQDIPLYKIDKSLPPEFSPEASLEVPSQASSASGLMPAIPANQPPGNKGPNGQPPQGKNLKDMKGMLKLGRIGKDDNSNTQFAMLALWAARRHDVPIARAMALVDQRFRASQLYNGAWNYHFHGDGDGKPSMICVGLLGLALGKGSAADFVPKNAKATDPAVAGKRSVGMDGQMRKGFESLSPHLQPQRPDGMFLPANVSLYFIWSVERVGVLYDLHHIGPYDWYQWGVDLLLPTQLGSGSWQTKSYPGSNATIDTSFALLFLKRVNLVQDLTDSLLQLQGIDESKTQMPK